MLTCPCNRCTKVPEPWSCDNKECPRWRKWFIHRWDTLRAMPRLRIEKRPREPEGLSIGGNYYALPHRVDHYLNTDPCEKCLCPRDLCTIACRVRRDWQAVREKVLS